MSEKVDRACETCQWFNIGPSWANPATKIGVSQKDLTHCRRYPPLHDKDNEYSEFPFVIKSFWCGEHTHKHKEAG